MGKGETERIEPATRSVSDRREKLILAPAERRDAVRRVIRGARKRIILSLFRCDDFKVLDELAAALKRGVQVEVLMTRRAKGGKKVLNELWAFLESMGASVHRYGDPVVKYHAKYLVADDGPALVASLNFTHKCFDSTCDFVVTTHDPAVVSGLQRLFEADSRAPESSIPPRLSSRLIVGPEHARDQFAGLLRQAQYSIRIIDHKVTDPSMVNLLKTKAARGVVVEVLGRGAAGGMKSHGKMMLVDESVAAIGSIALSALCLDFRREVGIIVREPRCVKQLNKFFQSLSRSSNARGRTNTFLKEAS